MEHRLARRRIALLTADGHERVEITRPKRALEKAGAEVEVLSVRPGWLRGNNFIWPGRKERVNRTLWNATPDDYDALYIPGGFAAPDLLRRVGRVQEFVREFARTGRPIASMCHGPQILISAGLVRGRRLTSWMNIQDDVRNAGGEWVDAEVVRDGNWVTSRGPQDIRAFNEAMIELFAEHAPDAGLHPARPKLGRWVAAGVGLAAVGVMWNRLPA